MATLLLDLDADTQGAVGSAVSSWTDSVGSRPFTQATTALQPAVVTGPNGHKGIQFAADYLASNAATPATQQAITVAMVVRADSVPTVARSGIIVAVSGAATNDYTTGWHLSHPSSTSETTFTSLMYGGIPIAGVDTRLKSSSQPLGQWVIITAVIGTDSPQIAYTNGTAETQVGAPTTAQTANPFTFNQLYLGCRWYTSPSDYSRVSIARMRVYSGRMTQAERAALHSSWQDTYGITVADYTATDVTAPTISTFTATAGNAQVALAWAGTDNVAITRWVLTRGGTTIYDGTATSYTDTGRTNGTALSYVLTAYDAAGNTKTASASATPVAPSDTTAPTVPSGVTATANSQTQVTLSWSPSTDAVGVASYRVRRAGSDLSGATALTGTTFVDTTVVAGTAYSYTVSAVDAAGNRSAESTAATVTTPTTLGKLIHRWSGTALVLQRMDRWSGSALVQRIIEGLANVTVPPSGDYPSALGTLTARPSWTNATVAAGPTDQPVLSRTRTLQLPNLPAAGSDLLAAWVAYFGNQTGTTGTWAAGDRVTIPAGEWLHSNNLDVPPAVNDVEIVLGGTDGACVLTSTSIADGNNTPPQIGLRVLSANNIRIRSASPTYQAILRSRGIAGRGDKNQQGHALLEVEYCTGFRAQDLLLIDSKAAGVFMYKADTYWFNRVRVERSKADAWHATNGSSYGIYSDCSSDGAGDDMMAFVHYDRSDPATSVSHHMEVYRYTGKRNGHGRGFAVIACHDIYADQVVLEGTAAASVIIDREARSSGSFPEQGIYNVLLQRFSLSGGNWSEQDHGSIFIGNGNTGNTVEARLESFYVKDNRLNQTAVRGVGSGTMTAVFKDFLFSGGLADAANGNRTKVGGNWTSPSTMTMENWVLDTSGPSDSTAPTVVINSPGHMATVSGTLTGSSGSSTHLMTNAQAIQYYVGDSPSGIASMTVTVDGSTGNGLGTPTARDSAGRGSVVWNTTAVANGTHTITVTGTDAVGITTTRSITVTVAN